MADLLDAAEDDARGGRVAKRSNHMAVSNIEWKDNITGRGDGRRASRGQVSQPRPARGRRGGLDGGGRTFFVVRKRPEGAAVKYWRSSQDTQLHV